MHMADAMISPAVGATMYVAFAKKIGIKQELKNRALEKRFSYIKTKNI